MSSLRALRIFVSYPRGGHAHHWAERIEQHLAGLGALPWRDETGVGEGDPNWYASIRDALVASDLVVCVVGGESERCRWQQREVLTADRLGLAVIAFRVDEVPLPFYLAEHQPVELSDPPIGQRSLDRLLLALDRATHRARPPVAAAVTPLAGNGPDPAARRREVDGLNALLHGEYSDREDRYVELEGRLRPAPAVDALRGLRMPTASVLQAFKLPALAAVPEAAAEPERFNDALDALRRLPARPAAVRRLAVLGEPGAGKSFTLERIACEYARHALRDPAAPVPLLLRLGLWTRNEPLTAFIEHQLGPLGRDYPRLRDAGRAVLLLDAVNEIPPGQRKDKATEIRCLADDTRHAAVVISCRQRDFEADFDLPFDRLTLQPLSPLQVHGFLHRAMAVGLPPAEAAEVAEVKFWQIAGEPLREVWRVWQAAGAGFERFWTAEDVPRQDPDVSTRTTWEQDKRWRHRADPRSLMALAANPFLLTVMMALPVIPPNRAQLFGGFLRLLHQREHESRQRRHDAQSAPDFSAWRAALVGLAETMQRLDSKVEGEDGGGARTSVACRHLPPEFDDTLLAFSIDANVLQRQGEDIRFTHQLLQESLAADALLDAALTGRRPASDFWPSDRWWRRSGWEVVAEIAAEACEGDTATQVKLVHWLLQASPPNGLNLWAHVGKPALQTDVLAELRADWWRRTFGAEPEPQPEARAVLASSQCAMDWDHRPGTGLRSDGLPDIDWVLIADDRPFIYQDGTHPPLPPYAIARYPVTNRQWRAFVDDGGYQDARWWQGLAEHPDPAEPAWGDWTAPRVTVSWFEAMAFARWLSHRSGRDVSLPTEVQWERAARGVAGREYPWGDGYQPGRANINETWGDAGPHSVGRTSVVGVYPKGQSLDGVQDLAGNVWEWCLNEHVESARTSADGAARRAVRGGSWGGTAARCRAAARDRYTPDGRYGDGLGFRVCW